MASKRYKSALEPAEYTVGWLCSLDTELRAARAMLDEAHEPLQLPNDSNFYVPGIINGHTVVIACASEAGNIPMSICASNMGRSFERISLFLLVGIGGGVPSLPARDIRLGDVVVGTPYGLHGGVAFHGPGKLIEHGFVVRGHLNRPSTEATNIVNFMRSEDNQVAAYLAENMSDIAAAAEGLCDTLYVADDSDMPTARAARSTHGPVVHHGLIISGEMQVKTSGAKRQEIIKQIGSDVLCFDRAAAGVVNDFPCLVIRGISNYCDGHDYDDWEPYAAAAGAAYCKWFLNVRPRPVVQMKPMSKELMSHSDTIGSIAPSEVHESPGMRPEDLGAISEACKRILEAKRDPHCTLKRFLFAVQQLDLHIRSALSHYQQSRAHAQESSLAISCAEMLRVTQYAQNVRSIGTGAEPALGNQWELVLEALEQRMEQVRDLRRCLSSDADKGMVDDIFAGLTINDFLFDFSGMQIE